MRLSYPTSVFPEFIIIYDLEYLAKLCMLGINFIYLGILTKKEEGGC